MKTLLNLREPCADWKGLAHVISKSTGLRDDITLVIEADRLRFFDRHCRELPTEQLPARWVSGSIAQLATRLSLLDWLYEHFPAHDTAHEPGNHHGSSAA